MWVRPGWTRAHVGEALVDQGEWVRPGWTMAHVGEAQVDQGERVRPGWTGAQSKAPAQQ